MYRLIIIYPSRRTVQCCAKYLIEKNQERGKTITLERRRYVTGNGKGKKKEKKTFFNKKSGFFFLKMIVDIWPGGNEMSIFEK